MLALREGDIVRLKHWEDDYVVTRIGRVDGKAHIWLQDDFDCSWPYRADLPWLIRTVPNKEAAQWKKH